MKNRGPERKVSFDEIELLQEDTDLKTLRERKREAVRD
jgi:hypothetical protein